MPPCFAVQDSRRAHRRRGPGTRRLTQGLPEPLLEEMRAGRHDLVITPRRPRGRALNEVPMVTYAEDPILRRYWRSVFGKQLTARAAVTMPDLYAVLSAADAGAGYSVLPRSLCQEYLDSGRLSLLNAPEEAPLNTMFLVQRPGADANPDVVRVRDCLGQAALAR